MTKNSTSGSRFRRNLLAGLVASSFTYLAIVSSPSFSFANYLNALAVIYVLAYYSMTEGTDKRYSLVGYWFWILSYIGQIYYGVTMQVSTWPLVCGAYYVVNEYLTCHTTVFESKDVSYVTPTYVRVGYTAYFLLDVMLNVITIAFGTGADYDELGLMPIRTVQERLVAFGLWMAFWTVTTVASAKVFNPRQAKYAMCAFHFICHASTVRLPVFAQHLRTHAGLTTLIKFQVFGSGVYVVRNKAPPAPMLLFRLLLWFLSITCGWMASDGLAYTLAVPVETFRWLYFGWFGAFYAILWAYKLRGQNGGEGTTEEQDIVADVGEDNKNKQIYKPFSEKNPATMMTKDDDDDDDQDHADLVIASGSSEGATTTSDDDDDDRVTEQNKYNTFTHDDNDCSAASSTAVLAS